MGGELEKPYFGKAFEEFCQIYFVDSNMSNYIIMIWVYSVGVYGTNTN